MRESMGSYWLRLMYPWYPASTEKKCLELLAHPHLPRDLRVKLQAAYDHQHSHQQFGDAERLVAHKRLQAVVRAIVCPPEYQPERIKPSHLSFDEQFERFDRPRIIQQHHKSMKGK